MCIYSVAVRELLLNSGHPYGLVYTVEYEEKVPRWAYSGKRVAEKTFLGNDAKELKERFGKWFRRKFWKTYEVWHEETWGGR